MNQNILKYLKNYSYDTKDVNRLLVSSFLQINNIGLVENTLINSYRVSGEEVEEYQQLQQFIVLFREQLFGIEELMEFFEFVISPEDKEVNGAVFTPNYIRENIVSSSITKANLNAAGKPLSDLLFADIACGCGGFFKTIAVLLNKELNKSFYEIYKDNIFGLDIQEYSITRTKILLSLLAIINGEDRLVFDFNLYCGNALDFNWQTVPEVRLNSGFDIIVGNPPYVGATKMDEITKLLLKKWSVSSIGKPDLYIPFFEIGMENLCNSGILALITVNTFYKSLNGRAVRSYFAAHEFNLTIIDFGGEQVFKNRSTYTCICIIEKNNSPNVQYIKTSSRLINSLNPTDFVKIPYNTLDHLNGWYLVNDILQKTISKIENIGRSLGDRFTIRNGFATLKNNVYLFKPIRETDDLYFFIKDGSEYPVERSICRDAIKPNTLKSAEELPAKIEKLIFPYSVTTVPNNDLFATEQRILSLISPMEMEVAYPFALEYLKTQRKVLSERDKGTREYDEWYAFGRNQALTINGNKLLFPYISDKPNFVFTEDRDLLFYNGYAIISESVEDLMVLQKILMSKIFWFYIKSTSKPYSGEFFSVAKNYIKNFGICELTPVQRTKLLRLNRQDEIDAFLEKIYDIKLI